MVVHQLLQLLALGGHMQRGQGDGEPCVGRAQQDAARLLRAALVSEVAQVRSAAPALGQYVFAVLGEGIAHPALGPARITAYLNLGNGTRNTPFPQSEYRRSASRTLMDILDPRKVIQMALLAGDQKPDRQDRGRGVSLGAV